MKYKIIESDVENDHWRKVKTIWLRLIVHEAKDASEEDYLVLRLESPQDDPDILKQYPDSVVVWQSMRLDDFAAIELRNALNDWVVNGVLE